MRFALATTLLAGALTCLATSCQVMPWAEEEDPTTVNRDPYELVIRGNDSISRNALRGAIAADMKRFIEQDFSRAIIDDAAWSIREHYLKYGFPAVLVSYEYEPIPGETPAIQIDVTEGPRCIVGAIHFQGVHWFSPGVLKTMTETRGRSVLGTGKPLFIAAQLNAVSNNLEDAYYENGFLTANVEGPEVVFNADRTQAFLTYVVTEGVRSVISEIELPDDLEDAGELSEALEYFLGRAYFPRVAFQVEAAVVEHFARRGHPEVTASVVDSSGTTDGPVSLTIEVELGPVVHIGKIKIAGNEETRSSFIRSRVRLQEGDLYDREMERDSFRDLYRTGLFRVVRIELLGEGSLRDLQISVEELPSLEIYAEPGYGSYERLRIRAGITERDLFGTGRRGRLEGIISQKSRSLTGTVTDPWLFESAVVADLSLFVKEREEPSFTSQNYGAQTLFTREWTRSFSVSGGYGYRQSDAKDIKVGGPGVEYLNDNVDLSIISFASTWDHRDSVFLPRAGRNARALVEFSDHALGSDLNFTRLTGTFTNYWQLSERSGIVASVSSGFAAPYGSTITLPLQERFFNGGANSVRSFRESQLGPKDAGGNPVGGETSSTMTLEFRYPIWKSFEGDLFWDAGNVLLRFDDYLSFRDIRHGIGPGLRWLLPIGPVRLDWGINPDPRDGESRSVVHFSIGSSF